MVMPAGKFKAKCLQIMDDIQKTHEEVLVTKHGRPVAKLVAVPAESTRALFGFLKGTVSYHGSILEPTGEKWNADK